jgi:hypothetical protein
MKLERYTVKKWGKYPRCQHVENGEQCATTVYADDVCWNHYGPKVPPKAIRDSRIENESSNEESLK